MDWHREETNTAHVDGEHTYTVTGQTDAPFRATRQTRKGSFTTYTALGDFDTIEEAQAACEKDYDLPHPEPQPH